MCESASNAACCLPDDSCQLLAKSECTASLGIPLPEGIQCEADTCTSLDEDTACCFADESCQVLSVSGCNDAGGTPNLEATCGPDTCAKQGACCLGSICQMKTKDGCAETDEAVFLADVLSCSATTCNDVLQGACCTPDGGCQDTSEAECNALFGAHSDGTTCAETACSGPGACCVDGECSVNTLTPCLGDGGTFAPGEACEEDTCDEPVQETCCLPSGTCQVISSNECEFLGGTVLFGVPCVQGICAGEIYGACCNLDDGACSMGTTSMCDAVGPNTSHQGEGTDCTNTECPEPQVLGACCFLNGGCDELTESDCVDGNGGWVEGGSCDSAGICDVNPTGACCLDSGGCIDTAESECAGQGQFAGAGSLCALAPCGGADANEPTICCVDTACEVATVGSCEAKQGTALTSPGQCLPSGCTPLPTIGCCGTNGVCATSNAWDCEQASGVNIGDDCSEAFACKPPGGAGPCCSASGCSIVAGPDECAAQNGLFTGYGGTCSDVQNCTPIGPVGACCEGSLICAIKSETNCTGQFTADSNCDGVVCNAADVPGACCVEGECLVLPLGECLTSGGEYTGGSCDDASQCGEPAVEGACCGDSGCAQSTLESCNGTFMGEGTTCGAVSCGNEEACCASDGSCTNVTTQACTASGGTPKEDAICFQNPCGNGGAGACCIPGGGCTPQTQSGCIAAEGVYKGAGSTCGGDTCSDVIIGACCAGGQCDDEAVEEECSLQGGTFTPNVDCSAVNCVDPDGFGACCLAGECISLPKSECDEYGGTHSGGGTDCNDVVCEVATPGACCLATGCEELSPNACTSAGGSFKGLESTCDSVSCDAPLVSGESRRRDLRHLNRFGVQWRRRPIPGYINCLRASDMPRSKSRRVLLRTGKRHL